MSARHRFQPRGQRRLRTGRRSLANQVYHITTVTYGRKPTFADLRCGRAVVEALREVSDSGRCHTLCFVVMPDHLHWLMQMADNEELAACVRKVKGSSARRINRLRGGSQRVWQAAFHDHALRRDEDVIAVARYIIANPVRANLVTRVGDYPLWDAVWL